MNPNQSPVQGPFAEILRNWTPPAPKQLTELDRRTAELQGIAGVAHLAMIPAGLAVLAPMLDIKATASAVLVGGLWAVSIAMVAFAAVALLRAKRRNAVAPIA